MERQLEGVRVAVLATDGVEQVELTEPMQALERAGAEVDLLSIKGGTIQGFNHLDQGDTFPVDRTLDDVSADDYQALMLPGGVANPDALRMDPRAVQLVRGFFAARKPVAAICHAPWLLVEADVVRHRTLTSWPSLKTDVTNAGGNWVDRAVVVDNGLVTSRKPDDLGSFCEKMIEEFGESEHRDQESTGRDVQRTASGGERGKRAMSRDEAVEISSEESFPASDSPSSLQVT